MFKNATIRRIHSHKWSTHSNLTRFFERIRDGIHLGLKDMTLIAKELPEEQLSEIFTEDKLQPFLQALLKPRNKRTILLTEMMARVATDKLFLELPIDMVNSLGGDIGKTATYARLLVQYADKPLIRKR